jgi:hypothetical protein
VISNLRAINEGTNAQDELDSPPDAELRCFGSDTWSYPNRIQSKNNPISAADSGVFLDEPKGAADAAKRKAPDNFRNLVDYLGRHQAFLFRMPSKTAHIAAADAHGTETALLPIVPKEQSPQR